MEQIELFDDEGPQPVQRWLHVWTEAERAERKKCPAPEAQGEGSPKRGEDAGKEKGVDEWIMPPLAP